MYNITLIEGRHQAVMNGDLPMFNPDGNLLVQDVQDNNIFTVPVCEETLKFFNLQFAEESLIPDNSGLNYSDIEQGESTDKVSFTACWKDDNEVRCLIYLWRDHQNNFKSMKSRDLVKT